MAVNRRNLSWKDYKKLRDRGEFDNEERDVDNIDISSYGANESAKRRYEEYMKQLHTSEAQADIVKRNITNAINTTPIAKGSDLYNQYVKETQDNTINAFNEMTDPTKAFGIKADNQMHLNRQPEVIRDSIIKNNNEKILKDLTDIKTGVKKSPEVQQAEANSSVIGKNGMTPETLNAAKEWNKAQQSGNLDRIENAEKELRALVGNNEDAYINALTTAGELYQYDTDKSKDRNFLNDAQTYQYMDLKLKTLDKSQQDAIKLIQDGQSLNYVRSNQNANAAGKAKINEGRKILRESGMSDSDIDKYVEYAVRLQNRQSTEEYQNRLRLGASSDQNYDVDPLKATGKLLSNSAYALGSFFPAGISTLNGVAKETLNTVSNNKWFRDADNLGVRDKYANSNLLSNASEYAQSQVLNNVIGSNHPFAQGTYEVGMSTLEAAEVAALSAVGVPESVTMLPYFGMSYNSEYNSARERGETPQQAQISGLAAGSAEVITEKISLDNLLGDLAKAPNRSWGEIIKASIKQGGFEASEEMASEVLNRLSDYAIAGESGKSQYETDVKNIMRQNPDMTEEEARKQAEFEWWKQFFKAGIAGASSGVLLGLGGGFIARRIGANNVNQENTEIEKIHGEESDYGKNPYQLRADIMEEGDQKKAMQELADKASANGNKLGINDRVKVADLSSEAKYKSYAEAVLHGEEKVVDQKQAEEKIAKAASEGDLKTMADTYHAMQIAVDDNVREAADSAIETYKTEMMGKGITEEQWNNAMDKNNSISPAKGRQVMTLAGKIGSDYETTKEQYKLMLQGFSEEQMQKMYKDGQQAAVKENRDKVLKSLKPNNYNVGKFDNEDLAKEAGVNTDVIKAIATISGINFKFESNVRDKNGQRINASFNSKTNTIAFNADTASSIVHELGEFTERYNRGEHDALTRDLMTVAQGMGTTFQKEFNDYKGAYVRAEGTKTDMEVAREMTNDLFVTIMSTEEGQRQLAEYINKKYDQQTARSKAQQIADFFRKIVESIKSLFTDGHSNLNEFQQDMLEKKAKELSGYADRFIKAFDNAVENYQNGITEQVGVSINTEEQFAYPSENLSLSTWNQTDYVQKRDEAAQALHEALGVSVRQAKDYIDQINSVASIIMQNAGRLDYMELEGKGMLMDNSEYKKTLDGSTLCKKRLDYTDTLSEIQRRLPNTALTGDEMLSIVNMMQEKGYQTPCGLCYVESTRKQLPKYAKEFLSQYAKEHPNAYVPNMAEINTPEGLNQVRSEHPEVYDEYIKYMNKKGNAKPKLFQTRAAYQAGEITDFFNTKRGKKVVLNKTRLKKWNTEGGMRLQSYSDFEVPQMIDMMQAILDMSRVGLWSQAYTKVPEFADIFGGTGVKINLSTIAKDVKNGQLVFDDVEGINHREALRIRDKYSDNVGIVTVVFNDEQLKAALTNPNVDYVLPFHRSSWSMVQARDITGQKNLKDYTPWQNEKHPTIEKIKNIMPNTYWDFSKDGRANAEKYLELCAKDGRTPKFSFLLNENNGKYTLPVGAIGDNYFKLLIDFKMYNNEGQGRPQVPVMPNFDMDVATRVLNEYQGDHNRSHAHMDIVDEFVDKYISNKSIDNSMANGDDLRYSVEVTSKEKIAELENQEHYTTYRAFQIIDGKLYSPKKARESYVDENGRTKTKLGYSSKLGVWEQATESLDVAKEKFSKGKRGKDPKTGREYAKFDLDKIKDIAYNPYLHSSNLVLNDQFTGAYNQNIVVVECVVPKGEENGAYWAELAKDPTGWTEWKSGGFAGDIAKQKPDLQRQVFLSRYMKPVRIMSDEEVAKLYKSYMEGTSGIEVPWNVVTPSLRKALVNEGVPIKYGKAYGTNMMFENVFPDERYSLNMHNTDFDDIRISDINYSKKYIKDDEFYISDKDRFRLMSTRKNKNLKFFNVAYSYNHIFLYNNYNNTREGYDIIAIIDADDVRANIHEANRYGNKRVQDIIDAINEKLGDDKQIHRRSGELLVYEARGGNDDRLADRVSRFNRGGDNGSVRNDTSKFSFNVDDLDDWMISLDELMLDLEEKVNAPKKRKEYVKHLRRAALGDEFNVVDGKKIAFTDERVEKLLKSYASTQGNYAQAYVTYMSPADFLLLTTNGTKGTKTLDKIKNESTPLDMEELIKQMDYQPMFLNISEKGKKVQVTGHEGRHRMYALQRAGFTQIPVLVFNYDNKYTKVAINSIDAIPQDFTYGEAHYNKSNYVKLNNLQPLSRDNADNIRAYYGSGTDADVRYSLNIDLATEFVNIAQEFDWYSVYDEVGGDTEIDNEVHSVANDIAKGNTGYIVDTLEEIISDDDYSEYHERAKKLLSRIKKVERYSLNVDSATASEAFDFNEDGRLVLKDADSLGLGDWRRITREFNLLGYGFENPERAKEVFTRLSFNRPYIFNDDQAKVVKKLYGIKDSDSNSDGTLLDKDIVKYVSKAEKTFGTTKRFDIAGYLTTNGTLLDFSDGQRYRVQDHREISEILDLPEDSGYSDGLIQFMNMGNIRLQSYGIDIAKAPNNKQKSMLRSFFDSLDGEVTVDFSSYQGATIGSVEYSQGTSSSRILRDIDSFYETGNVPNGTTGGINDYRYSLDVTDSLSFLWENDPETASILSQGMEALKNQKVDVAKIRGLAIKLRNEFGSSYDVKTLTNNLEKVFAYLQTEDHVNYNDVVSILNDVAKPVIEAATYMEGREEYQAFIDEFKGYRIKLNDKQKKEVISLFGSYGEYKNAVMPIRISDKGTITLDEVWGEISDKMPWLLPMDTTELDMPMVLSDALAAVRPTPKSIYGGDIEDVSRDFAMRVIEEYIGGEVGKKMKSRNEAYKQRLREDYNKRLTEARAKVRSEGKDKLEKYKQSLKHSVDEAKYRERWAAAEGKKKVQDEIAAKKYKLEQDYEIRKWNLEAEANKDAAAREKDYMERKARLYARNKQKAADARERQAQREQRKNIQRMSSTIVSWIENPTEKNHVPKSMRLPLLDFISAFDFVEPVIKANKDGGFYARIYNGNAVYGEPQYEKVEGATRDEVRYKIMQLIENGFGSSTQQTWLQKMESIRSLLKKAKDSAEDENADYNNIIQMLDPELVEEFDNLISANAKSVDLSNMSSSDLKTIAKTMKGLMHAIRVGNNAITQMASIEEWAQKTIDNSKTVNLKNHTSTMNKIIKMFSLDMATPDTFFSMMGEAGKSIMKTLSDGFDRKVKVIKAAQEYVNKTKKDLGFTDKDIDKLTGENAEVIPFKFGDQQIKLTRAQLMSLYVLNKRNQAVLHFAGGLEADTIKVKEGKNIVRVELNQNTPSYFTRDQIIEMTNQLSDKEKKLADALQQFLANECGKWGNEASMLMYGYEKFLDPNYFPISTDKTTHKAENTDRVNSLNGIERMGMTKDVSKFANNPLIIKDIFDVYIDHTSQMSAYYGYAAAIKDANRWFNFKFKEDIGNGFNRQVTVKSAINTNVFRTDNAGIQYYDKLIRDINGNEISDEIKTWVDSLMGTYKGQSISGNMRVVVQQPTAIVRAANVIDWKYLVKGIDALKIGSNSMERIKEVCPLAWWKSQGYYETSMGKPIREIITGQASFRDKLIEKSMWMAGKADDITWSVIYTAVEKEQSELNRGKKVSEEDFRKQVNERFNEIIYETQVVDAVLQKSQWMRGKGTWNKLQTSFMAEPIKSYNMGLKAAMLDYKDMQNGNKTLKRTGKAMLVLTVTDMVNAAAQSFIDAFRHKDDDDKYWEMWFKYFTTNFLDNINPFKKVPVVKDIWTKLVSKVNGDYEFSNDMQSQALDSVLNVLTEIKDRIEGKSKKTGFGSYMVFAKAISVTTGIPFYNVSRDFAALYNSLPFDDLRTKALTKTDFINDIEEAVEKNDPEQIKDQIEDAITKGDLGAKDIKDTMTKRYKKYYKDALGTEGKESADQLLENFRIFYEELGMSDDEIQEMFDGWNNTKEDPYADLDAAIESGEGIRKAMIDVLQNKKDDDVIEHLMSEFGTEVDFESTIGSTEYQDKLTEAFTTINGTYTYDNVVAILEEQAPIKAAEKEKKQAVKEANTEVIKAIESGDLKKVSDAISAAKEAGATDQSLKTKVTTEYKDQFIEAYKNGDTAKIIQIRNRVAQAKNKIDNKKTVSQYLKEWEDNENDWKKKIDNGEL